MDFLFRSVKVPDTICLLRSFYFFKATVGFDEDNKLQDFLAFLYASSATFHSFFLFVVLVESLFTSLLLIFFAGFARA